MHSLATRIMLGFGLTLFGVSIFTVTAKAQDAGLVDIAGSVGISSNAPSYGAYVADYDQDGRSDFLYNGDWKRPMRLFRNVGDRFVVDATTDFGLADRLDCAWGDPNQDGRPDFYCSVGAVHGTAPAKANQLWIQQSDGRFIDQAAQWRVTDPLGRGRDVVWLNYNGDAYPDLFVGNEFPRVDGGPTPNRLFVNEGGLHFVEAPIAGLTEEFGGYAAHAADLNRSGYDDLLVAGRNARLMVYQNEMGSGYRDIASTLQLGSAQDVTTADLTGNGFPDIILTRGHTEGQKVCVVENKGSWQFGVPRCYGSDVRRAIAVQTGTGGTLDIYAGRSGVAPSNLPDLLLRNNGGGLFDVLTVNASTTQGNAMRVRLAAIDHNGDGRDGVLVVNAGGGAPGPLELMVMSGAPPSAPLPPTNLTANARSSSRIVLLWRDNATNEQGFRIERRSGDEPWTAIGQVGANTTRYPDSGLASGTTYAYRVLAYNASDNSAHSNEANATTHGGADFPRAPSNLKVQLTSPNRVVLTWRDNANNEQGFRIERKRGAGAWKAVAQIAPNQTRAVNTGLSRNTRYRYRVQAFNASGSSTYAWAPAIETPR